MNNNTITLNTNEIEEDIYDEFEYLPDEDIQLAVDEQHTLLWRLLYCDIY